MFLQDPSIVDVSWYQSVKDYMVNKLKTPNPIVTSDNDGLFYFDHLTAEFFGGHYHVVNKVSSREIMLHHLY